MKKVWIMLALVASLPNIGCTRPRPGLLPKEIVGVWSTDDPKYAGRYLELSQAFVIVVTGTDDPPRVEWVDKVEASPSTSGTTYKISSTERLAGNREEMTILFSAANGGEIRFRNQKAVWRRKPKD
jgi:hypothetical protein